MNSTIRIGIVGAGEMGQRHAKLVADSNIAVMAGFADPDESASLNPGFAQVRHYLDHLKLIESETPDGIIISTQNTQHVTDAIN